VTHGGTRDFFTFSIGFSHVMNLEHHIEVVLTFSTVWVTFILKHFRFLVAVFVVLLLSLANFVCCTILSFQYQFEVI